MRRAIAFLLLACGGRSADLVLIRAGAVIDPEASTIARDRDILVEGARIKSLGPRGAIPTGAKVIDLSHLTVLPGLIDCHTHLCYPPLRVTPALFAGPGIPVRWDAAGAPAFFLGSLLNPTGYRTIHGVVNAWAMLEAGFTTVRDLGHGGNYGETDLRRAIEEGLVPGPTILNSGKKISPYGGQFTMQPETREQVNVDYLFADTRDEMLKAIRENVHYGAKLIKIIVAGQRYIYSAEDIRFIVQEAARMGMKVSADCATREGGRNAAEGGVASIEHAIGMTPEDFAVGKRNGVAFIVNVPPKSFLEAAGAAAYYPRGIDHLRLAYKQGVTLAFGTDIGFKVGEMNHGQLAMEFLETYSDAGVPAAGILQTMTVNAARLLGVEKDRGGLKPGTAADIVALAGNPLEDIQALKRVSFVMKDRVLCASHKLTRPALYVSIRLLKQTVPHLIPMLYAGCITRQAHLPPRAGR